MTISTALVVGAGPAGMVSAIALSRIGVDVHLVELAPAFGAVGVGVNLQNSPLRALHGLGLLDEVVARGFSTEVLNLLDAEGDPIAPPLRPPALVEGYPASVAIGRGVLADILAHAVEIAGVRTTFGTSLTGLTQDDSGVTAELTDGETGRYDLVIGADGIHSEVRRLLLGASAPAEVYSGQCIWRALAPRTVEEYQLLHQHGSKAGLVPISDEDMYVYVVTAFAQRPRWRSTEESDAAFLTALASFGGPAAGVAERIEPGADFRALTSVLVDDPWYRGRVLLIGDAAHATTPHISYGLGVAVEDGIVLAELVGTGVEAPAVLDAFMRRRFDRCSTVVRNSRQLSQWEQDPPADPGLPIELMRDSVLLLSQPI